MLLAGSFGAYLTPLSAVRIGLVPRLALPRIVSAGNVAGEGAKIAALSLRERAEAESILRRGRVRRALGPGRLQRPVHRPAGVPGMSARGRHPAARWRSTSARSRADAAGTSRSSPSTRCCTTTRTGSRPRVGDSCASATTWSRSPTPTAEPTARWTRSVCRGLAGEHCYDVFAARRGRARRSQEEPGTYFLTDFLARTFEHTVVRELGLDRHPELRDEYFRHYTRVMWLAQRPTPATRACAEARRGTARAAAREREVGTGGLERELERLLT